SKANDALPPPLRGRVGVGGRSADADHKESLMQCAATQEKEERLAPTWLRRLRRRDRAAGVSKELHTPSFAVACPLPGCVGGERLAVRESQMSKNVLDGAVCVLQSFVIPHSDHMETLRLEPIGARPILAHTDSVLSTVHFDDQSLLQT